MHGLRSHKLLLFIYLSGFALALFELTLPEDRIGELESPEAYLRPGINVADVSSVLYPERALTLYYRAYQASLCAGAAAASLPECRNRDPVKPGEIRGLIERSLATGNRSIEMAMYNYAMVLIQENAEPEAIDTAIRNWRVSYPFSSRPDPREMNRELKRQQQEQQDRPG